MGGYWFFGSYCLSERRSLLQEGVAESDAIASQWFSRALDCARGQGCLALELRAATSLARLLHSKGRSAEAAACLQPIYDRFTEGFDTADLIAAKRLLDVLGDTGR